MGRHVYDASMIRLLAASLLVAGTLGCATYTPSYVRPTAWQDETPATLISDVSVFTGFDPFLLRHVDVLLVGGRVRAIVPTGQHDLDGKVEKVSGEGRVLLPGLVDMHVHLGSAGEDPRQVLERLLYQGVTTAVVVGHDVDVEGLQREIAKGRIAGPRLFRSTRPIKGDGPSSPYLLGSVQVVGSPLDAARAARRDLERLRSDFVRIDWSPTFPAAAGQAVVAEARAYHKPVFAASSHGQGAAEAAEAGVALLLHPPWADRLSEEEAHRIALSGVPVVATFGLCAQEDAPPACAENLGENVRSLARAGVPLLGGSGAGTEAGRSEGLPAALETWVELGVEPAEVLAASTNLPVRLLDPKAHFGAVAPGAYADLVLVEGDPLEDIGAMGRVVAVWQGGRRVMRLGVDAD